MDIRRTIKRGLYGWVGLFLALTVHASPLNLTPEEQQWIQAHPQLRIAQFANWPPFDFLNAAQPTGFSIDFIKLLCQRLSLTPKFVQVADNQAAYNALNQHEVELIHSLMPSDKPDPAIAYTAPYLMGFYVIVTHNSLRNITQLADLSSKHIAVLQGNAITELIRKEYPSFELSYYPDAASALKAVSTRQADAYVDSLGTVSFMIQQNMMSNLQIIGEIKPTPLTDNALLRMGVSKDNPILLSIFNKAILSVSEDEHMMLYNRWIAVNEVNKNLMKKSDQVILSQDEQAWLAAHPTIHLGFDSDWPPFEMLDKQGQPDGMVADYIKLIEQKLGIELQITHTRNWIDTIKLSQSKQLDLVASVARTEERDRYLRFSQAYLSFPMVVVTRDNVTFINDLKDLIGKKILIVQGYESHIRLALEHPELTLTTVANSRDALKQLSQGSDAFAYIGNLATISHILKEEGLTNIKVSGELPYRFDLAFASRADWPELNQLLHRAIDAITPQEHDAIYRKWIKLSYPHQVSYQLFWKLMIGIGVIGLLLLYWNRKLRVLNAKIRYMHFSLGQAHQELQNYVELVDKYVLTITLDPEGCISEVSEAFCQMSGYSAQELQHRHFQYLCADDSENLSCAALVTRLQQQHSWAGELKQLKKNGSYYWVQMVANPKFDSKQQLKGYTFIGHNITNKKRVEELSITDDLTQIYNRRYFNQIFPKEVLRAKRHGHLLCFMILDIDNFKKYNDALGHQQGDQALRDVAHVLDETLRRAGDFAFRLGGEEFGALLTVQLAHDALFLCEQIRQAIEQLNIPHPDNNSYPQLTVSIGLAMVDDFTQLDLNTIYRLADNQLYKAKHAGRNQVCAIEQRAQSNSATPKDAPK